MRVSNGIQIGVQGYFLDKEIVNYFEVKKCSERVMSEAVEAAKDFQLQNPGYSIVFPLRVFWRRPV